MSDVTEPALLDQLLGVDHERCPAVVEADEREHACPPCGGLDLSRLFRPAPYRLLAEDVLAVGRRGASHLEMHMVGCGDVDDLNLWMLDEFQPVRGRPFETKGLAGLPSARRNFVGAHDQSRLDTRVREAQGNLAVGTAMHLPHPTHANDADTYFAFHGQSSALLLSNGRRPPFKDCVLPALGRVG